MIKSYLIFLLTYSLTLSQILVITTQNYLINAITSYQIKIIQRPNTLDPKAFLVFTFPNNVYSPAQLVNIDCSPIICTYSDHSINITTNQFHSPYDQITFVIYNITNPPTTQNPQPFQYSIFDSNSLQIQQANGFTSFFPTTLNHCQIKFLDDLVRKMSTAQITVKPNSPLLQNGSISIDFPNIWNNIPTNYSQTVFNQTQISCKITSPTNETKTCPCTLFSNLLTINQLFQDKFTSEFKIQINPILSTPTDLSNYDQVKISTSDKNGNVLDDFTYCLVIGPKPNQFFPLVQPTISNCSTNYNLILNFTSTDVITINDTFNIKIDGSKIKFITYNKIYFSIDDGSLISNYLNLNALISNSTSLYFNISSVILKTRKANASVNISGIIFQSPPTTNSSSKIQIFLMRAGGVYSYSWFSITNTPTKLLNLTGSRTNNYINNVADYTLNFTLYSPLSSSGMIRILIPTRIIPQIGVSCSSILGNKVNNNNKINCTFNQNELLINNIFVSDSPINNNISITITNLKNPGSIQPTNAFQIYTYYDNISDLVNYVDYDKQSIFFIATAQKINILSVSVVNNIIATNSDYIITYINSNKLYATSNIIIALPPQLIITDQSNFNCTLSINQSSPIQVSLTILHDFLTYSNAFNITTPFNSDLDQNTTVTFYFGQLVNPVSTKPINSFGFFSYDKVYLIQYQTIGLGVSNYMPSKFTSLIISRTNEINGEKSNFTISYIPSVNIIVGSRMQVNLPQQIQINSVKCYNVTQLNIELQCSLGSRMILINLTKIGESYLQVLNLYKIQISQIKNPRTFQKTSDLQIKVYDSENYIINKELYSGFINTSPNHILNFSSSLAYPAQSYLNSSQTIIFTLITFNYLTNNDYIQIIFPSQYSYSATIGSVCSQLSFICLPLISNNNKTIRITGNFNNLNQFNFTVNNYISPDSFIYVNQTKFIIKTFSPDDNQIDIIDTLNTNTDISFNLSCNQNCKTCAINNNSICTSCYPSSITVNILLLNGICVTDCDNKTYVVVSQALCSPCIIPCSTCVSPTSCTSCVNFSISNLYFFYNNQCLAECPISFFGDPNENFTCKPCDIKCLSCDITSSNCTSCNSSNIFYQNDCLSTCVDGTFNFSGFCNSCESNCATCENSSDLCLTCTSDYIKKGSSCTNICQTGKVVHNGMCTCDITCLTCINRFDYCLTCDQLSINPYFYNNSCINNCSLGTYLNKFNCQSCQTNCLNCTSLIICTDCVLNYYLYLNLCLQVCPQGYYQQIKDCKKCSNQCLQCQNTPNNCISCNSSLIYDNFDCVSICSNGKYKQANINGFICQICDINCKTCIMQKTNCLSCDLTKNLSLYVNVCVQTCPIGTISISNKCIQCLQPCLTCQNTTSSCLSCNKNYFTINLTNKVTCVGSCKNNGLFINDQYCTNCESPCNSCLTFSNFCMSCISGYYLFNSNCLTQCPQYLYIYGKNCTKKCPDNYTAIQKVCTDNKIIDNNNTNPNNTDQNNTNQNNTNKTQNNTTKTQVKIYQYKLVKFSMLITYSILFIVVIISKIAFKQTYFSGSLLSLNGPIEFLSWIFTSVYIWKQNYLKLNLINKRNLQINQQDWFLLSGLILILFNFLCHYIINFFNLYYYCKNIRQDIKYRKWIEQKKRYSFLDKLCIIFSFFVSYKMSNLPFSKLFQFKMFNAPLNQVKNYLYFNKVTGFGILNSVLMIVAYSLLILANPYKLQTLESTFVIQSLILTSINMLFAIITLYKDLETYFNLTNTNKKQILKQQLCINDTLENINEAQSKIIGYPGKKTQIQFGNNQNPTEDNCSFNIQIKDGARKQSDCQFDLNQDSSEYVSEQNNIVQRNKDFQFKLNQLKNEFNVLEINKEQSQNKDLIINNNMDLMNKSNDKNNKIEQNLEVVILEQNKEQKIIKKQDQKSKKLKQEVKQKKKQDKKIQTKVKADNIRKKNIKKGIKLQNIKSKESNNIKQQKNKNNKIFPSDIAYRTQQGNVIINEIRLDEKIQDEKVKLNQQQKSKKTKNSKSKSQKQSIMHILQNIQHTQQKINSNLIFKLQQD